MSLVLRYHYPPPFICACMQMYAHGTKGLYESSYHMISQAGMGVSPSNLELNSFSGKGGQSLILKPTSRSIRKTKTQKFGLDSNDREILKVLLKNARASSSTIRRVLEAKHLSISERLIRRKIRRMERVGAIKGYYTEVNPDDVGFPIQRVIVIKFRNEKTLRMRLKDLELYTFEAPFFINPSRVMGDIDFISFARFRTREEASIECFKMREEFHDIIQDFSAYDCECLPDGTVNWLE